MTPVFLIRGLLMIVLLAGLGFLLKSSGFGEVIDKNWIDAHIRSKGFEGYLIYVLVAAVLATIGFPRQIISFLAGYAFGLNFGFITALLACALGCILTFFFARRIGRDWIQNKFARRLAKADQFFISNTFTTTLLIRLMPVGSNFVTNLVAGVSGASAVSFVVGSSLGYIPQTLIFVLLGSGFNLDQELRISLSIILFGISILLGAYLYKKYKLQAHLSDK